MEKMVEVERATQEELRQDLKSLFQGAIRVTLEMVLEEELKAMVGARRFERVGSRKDHRNGTYLRRLLTSLGQIDVMVPRSREGGSPADVMGRYRRRSEEVDEMMVEAYVSGVSQRKMGDVTEALLGERVGRSTVRLVAKRLDGAVEALRSAPIEGPHPYLAGPLGRFSAATVSAGVFLLFSRRDASQMSLGCAIRRRGVRQAVSLSPRMRWMSRRASEGPTCSRRLGVTISLQSSRGRGS